MYDSEGEKIDDSNYMVRSSNAEANNAKLSKWKKIDGNFRCRRQSIHTNLRVPKETIEPHLAQ